MSSVFWFANPVQKNHLRRASHPPWLDPLGVLFVNSPSTIRIDAWLAQDVVAFDCDILLRLAKRAFG